MVEMPKARWWWHGRQRALVVPLLLFVAVVCLSQSRPAAQRSPASAAAARQAIRDRLERAVAGSRELFDRAPPARSDQFAKLLREAIIPEDRPGLRRGRFSPLKDVREYWRLRPWEPSYGSDAYGPVPPVATENWPQRSDAPELRELVSDADPAVRGLAVEALGALGLPEDVRRIAALLTDTAAAAPALARIQPRSTGGVAIRDENALIPMAWSDRTVSAYARAAVWLVTGQTFDGSSTVFNLSFPEWIETHDLGWESLWYWQRRFQRERSAVAAIEPSPGEGAFDFSQRRNEATDAYRAELRSRSVSDLRQLSGDAQAKVYLLTDAGVEWDSVTRPVNPLFPEGFTLRIGRGRILELLDGRNIWSDALESNAESVLLWRLGRLAPTLLPARDWPHVREQLQSRASRQPGMPVLVSRLLPAAKIGQANDPRTREGFLRGSLSRAVGDRRLQLIAAEMVRTNVEVQWPFLTARFNPDPAVGQGERLGALEALGETPRSIEKLVALVAFVEDPRNAALLTQRDVNLADLPRQRVVDALNAFSNVPRGRAYISFELQQDLGREDRHSAALMELRRLAQVLLAQTRAGAR
jgi:hypothetical protein